MIRAFFIILSCFIISIFVGCKKFIEVSPPITNLTQADIYKNDKSAISVLTSIYTKLSSNNSEFITPSIPSMGLHMGLYSDELELFDLNNTDLLSYYQNNLLGNEFSSYWDNIYPVIYTCNSAIEGINASTQLSKSVKLQLLGEAKFMRSFSYFYLVQIYGDVPLVLTTDYKTNSSLSRASTNDVYNQIITDLMDAKELLDSNYLSGDLKMEMTERVRPNKFTAISLLSRIYLYMSNWQESERYATEVINNNSIYDTTPLSKVFLKNSQETIWALQPVESNENQNTGDGKYYILPSSGPGGFLNPVYLSPGFVNKFETDDDLRLDFWVGKSISSGNEYYYANKYRIGRQDIITTEYPILLRLAELYLIRAEARIRLQKIKDGQDDLNLIRRRAGLPNTATADQSLLLKEVLHERQLELFTEMGHRFFDLKRTGNINEAMSDVSLIKSGALWNINKALLPIPQEEINRNVNLQGFQNPGYN
jgi:starch-binding outer membrane protein, SusD/RagB family